MNEQSDHDLTDKSTDAGDIEMVIDLCRLDCDWNGVLCALKRYTSIFDTGAATSTYQHDTLDSVRAYYWVCMGETAYEMRGDYYNAVDSMKRAMVIDPLCFEAKVIIARILLENSESALKIQPLNHSRRHNNSVIVADLNAGCVLSELLKVRFLLWQNNGHALLQLIHFSVAV